MDFLKLIGLINEEIDVPEWILELKMFDDEKQKDIISENEKTIEVLEEKIVEAQERIDKNNEYKSILYTNGDSLVSVVFEILEKLLQIDLSDFQDKKKEDFLIRFEDVTFIGEIKGVTSNVKSEHISQLDVHLQEYQDELQETGSSEYVKSILIINHQRNYELDKRQPVHENQINLAKRNSSIIIETYTLLKMFEKFINNELKPEEFREKIKREVGLITD